MSLLNGDNSQQCESSLPSWELCDLYNGVDDERIALDCETSLADAKSFQAKYRGKLKELSPDELLLALKSLEAILERCDKPVIFAQLLHAADSSNSAHGTLLSKMQENSTETHQYLTFFSLEFNHLSEQKAGEFINSRVLTQYHHHLRSMRKYLPHQLSESEEVLWQNLSLVGANAWSRLFDETLSRSQFTVSLPSGSVTLSEEETLALLYDPNRDVRRVAAEGLSMGLRAQAPLLTFILNTILNDSAIEDRLRHYPHIKKSRNLSNDIDDASVEALIESTMKHSHLVSRFYKLKARLLGLDKLYDYDRYAPLPAVNARKWTWSEAKEFVIQAFGDFDAKFADIASQFFDRHWIDAALRTGKRGGAFSASTVPSVHPYILMNFTGTDRDVSTLAHELGHGVHQYLSGKVGYLLADTPLTTAETASVFAEMLTFDRMLKTTDSKAAKLSLIVGKLDDIIATVFRQICTMTKFEEIIHTHRRERGELTLTEFNSLWLQVNRQTYGDSIELTEDYGIWWSYVGHFVHSPFYCYAYAFGLLLSMTLYKKWQVEGDSFKQSYIELLSAGGSVEPVELIGSTGVNIADPSFWEGGFKLVEGLIVQCEELI